MNKKLIVANWKNNPAFLEEARFLFKVETEAAQKYPQVQTVICPPEKFFYELTSENSFYLGAQDFFGTAEEMKPAKYVLIGHSDRRYPPVGGGESDAVINQKIKLSLAAGVTPILLVGEKERGENTEAVITDQLAADLAGLSASEMAKILICYEPVWAISTNLNAEPDTPENTLQKIGVIKNFLSTNYKLQTTNYLYGGSVTASNVTDFLKHSEINGAVIGGASLRSEEFAEILRVVSVLS